MDYNHTINLFYLSDNRFGGWVTYTAHLIYGLKQAGVKVNLFKIGNRTEYKPRPFGYNCEYRNITLDDARLKLGASPGIITALQKNSREKADALLDSGAWMIVHDPAEFKNLTLIGSERYITIRKAVQSQVEGSTFIPHPYNRHYPEGTVSTNEIHACSISRIDFDKYTEIMMGANRLLPEDKRIQIHGFENRLYTKFKLCPEFPEWEQSVSQYSRGPATASSICNKAKFSVDMSAIKGDGGGTQYTFMEAMDAGSINILHQKWILPDDEMISLESGTEANCIGVIDEEDLAGLLCTEVSDTVRSMIISNGEKLLRKHNPKTIAFKFIDLLFGVQHDRVD